MKTTVEIADPLFLAARAYCLDRGITFRQLLESGVRMAMKQPSHPSNFRLKQFGFQGEGQSVQEWSEIRDLIYAERGTATDTPDLANGAPE